jgi:predicted HTH transcriptional regulator
MSRDAAIAGGRSDARNSRIFNIFALIDIGERSGTGLSDIFATWKECGYEQPTITETYQPDQLSVVVFVETEVAGSAAQEQTSATQETNGVATETGDVALKNAKVAPKTSSATQETGATTQETTRETGVTTQETTQENTAVAQETVMATQGKNADVASRIMEMLRLEPEISLSRIADSLGLSREGVRYHINVLKKTMGLRHEGPTKKGYWVIGEA